MSDTTTGSGMPAEVYLSTEREVNVAKDNSDRENAKLPLANSLIAICAVILGCEYSVLYFAFEPLSGRGEYFNPHALCFSGGLLIVGYHYLIGKFSAIKASINRLALYGVIAYLVGVGLFVAYTLFQNSGGGFPQLPDWGAQNEGSLFGWIPDSEEVVNWVFESFVSPIGKILIGIGLGLVTLVNAIIFHSCSETAKAIISGAKRAKLESTIKSERFTRLKTLLKERNEILVAKSVVNRSEDTIRDEILHDINVISSDALRGARLYLDEKEFTNREPSVCFDDKKFNRINVEARVKEIDLRSDEDWLNAMEF